MLKIKLVSQDAENLVGCSGCWKSSWMLRMPEIYLDAQDAKNLVGC